MSSSTRGDAATKVEAFYEKANFFRVIHADGVYGGLTPHGNMHFAFYSERRAIPRRVEFEIVDGIPGPEKVVEGKDGMFREIEADIIMSFTGAVSFHLWLETQLETMRTQLKITQTDWENMVRGKKST